MLKTALILLAFLAAGPGRPDLSADHRRTIRETKKLTAAANARAVKAFECSKCGGRGKLAQKVPLDRRGQMYAVRTPPCPKCHGDGIYAGKAAVSAVGDYYAAIAQVEPELRRRCHSKPPLGRWLAAKIDGPQTLRRLQSCWSASAGESRVALLAAEVSLIDQDVGDDDPWVLLAAGPLDGDGAANPDRLLVLHGRACGAIADMAQGPNVPMALLVIAHRDDYAKARIDAWLDATRPKRPNQARRAGGAGDDPPGDRPLDVDPPDRIAPALVKLVEARRSDVLCLADFQPLSGYTWRAVNAARHAARREALRAPQPSP